MRILAKIGGAQLEQPGARDELCRAIAAARHAGHELVLVHGGGNQMRALGRRLALEERYHDGLRVTDAATAEAALMVLGGLVNRQLVAALQERGVRACGLSGADGGIFTARPHRPGGTDLGYVGAIERVDPTFLEGLLVQGVVPVVATVAPLDPGRPGPRDRFYNINADQVVGPLARALDAGVVLFLTDVPAVLDAGRRPLPVLDPRHCDRLRNDGALGGGMVPKVEAALTVRMQAPSTRVKIAPAQGENAILRALDEGVGTEFVTAASPARGVPWTST